MTDAVHSQTGTTAGQSGELEVRAQLLRILKSGPFQRSQRRQRFLEYIVNETLAGRGDRIKGYTIAVEVFDRPASFDSNVDPTVRMEAARLRDRLREYYETDGHGDPIRIELPKGSYIPKIEHRQAQSPEAASGDIQGEHRLDNKSMLAGDDRGRVEHSSIFGWSGLTKIGLRPFGMLAIAVMLIIAASLSWMKGPNSGPSLHDRPSIAVLPFDNIGDDPKWERFADGITEDIIADISHSKDFIVIARNSTEIYKGKPIDIRQVGRDLGTKYVLEGSIQSMGERIRVTAQLIEATSGSHVWSERYDRPAADLFAVQNDVTQQIAATLAGYQGAVAEAERSVVRRKSPASLTAFDTYLMAMEAKHKVTKDSLAQADDLFRKALELDPQLARAYVGIVDVQFYLIDLGLAPSNEVALSKMLEAGEKAVKLDPNDGKTHLALGLAYAYHGKSEQALAEFTRAEALAPSDADLLLIVAWTIPALGESTRAVNLAERALMLNPNYPYWYNQGLSLVFLFGGQYERSVKYRQLVKEPLALDYAFLAIAYAEMGRTREAEEAAAKVSQLDPSWIAEKYLSEAGGYAEREAEMYVEGAKKAGLSACVPSDKIKENANLIHVRLCDRQRAKIAG